VDSREDAVRAALTRAGVPSGRHAEFVRFEMAWGGRSDGLGKTDAWGLVHDAPRWGNSKPGEVDAEFDDELGR
jgi:hypothetical protein